MILDGRYLRMNNPNFENLFYLFSLLNIINIHTSAKMSSDNAAEYPEELSLEAREFVSSLVSHTLTYIQYKYCTKIQIC